MTRTLCNKGKLEELFSAVILVSGTFSSFHPHEPDLEDLLSILKNEVFNKKNKNVEVLQLAANVARRMSGNAHKRTHTGCTQ